MHLPAPTPPGRLDTRAADPAQPSPTSVLRTALAVALLALVLLTVALLIPAPAAGITGPAVEAYSPPAAATNVSTLWAPWVKFTTAINPTTLTSSTFYLNPLGSPEKVPASLSYIEAQKKAKLTPAAPLTNGVTYQATVTVGITDGSGNPLQAPWTWTFTVVAEDPANYFVDVEMGHPYYEAIQGLRTAGVISGYVGTTGPEFRPDNPVLRAQFAKMICGALGLTVTEDMTSPFTDLDPDDPLDLYPHEYVAAAYTNGITSGTSATSFSPWIAIKRAQVITMGVRALENLAPEALLPVPPGFTPSWSPSFSSIHGPKAVLAEANGLLDGLGADPEHPTGNLSALDPWGIMPRGEVAQFLWNMVPRITAFALTHHAY